MSHYIAWSVSCTWFYLQDSLHINPWEQDEGSASILDYQASMLCLLIQSLRIVRAFLWFDVPVSDITLGTKKSTRRGSVTTQ